MREKHSSRLFIGNTLRIWHFQCTNIYIYWWSNENFEIFCQMNIKGLHFENLKRKMWVIGQNINMGFYGKMQRSPAKNGQVVQPQETTSLSAKYIYLL